MRRSILCPPPRQKVGPTGDLVKKFYAVKLLKYAILILFFMFFGHNVARICKNSALKRAAGENFAVLCIKTVKLAILLKIGARGWEI